MRVAGELGGDRRGAALRRRRRRPPQDLLDRRRQERRVGAQRRAAGRGARRARARPPAMALRVVSAPGGEQQAEEHVQLVVGERRRVDVVERGRARRPTACRRPGRARFSAMSARAVREHVERSACGALGRRRPRGSRSPARPPRTGRGDPPRARRAGCRSSASAARRRPRRGSRSARRRAPASSSAPARRRSSSSRRRTVRGVRPLLTSRRIRAWRGSSIMLSTTPGDRAGPGAACRRTGGRRRVSDE